MPPLCPTHQPHHESLLDGVDFLLLLPPPLGDEQGSLKQEHSPLLQGLPIALLAGEEVLQDEGPEFVEAEGAVDEAEVDGIVGLGGDSARHFQTVVDVTSWEACTNTDRERERMNGYVQEDIIIRTTLCEIFTF